jgi:hypothetical protein
MSQADSEKALPLARRAGKPTGGVAKLDEKAIRALPEECSCSELSRQLTVSPSTLSLWRRMCAMPVVKREGRFVVQRQAFLVWAEQTGRLLKEE